MFALLLSGDGTVATQQISRAQIPLLLAQVYTTPSTQSVDIATETDSALTATVFIGAELIPADIAVEADTAFAVTVDVTTDTYVSADLATEDDESFDVTLVASVQGTYPGSAYPSSTTYPWSGAYYAVDIATETDSAFDVDSPIFDFLFPVSATNNPSLTAVSLEDEDMLSPVTPV